MSHKLNTNNKGFTLIELLVVISIIGLLSSVVVGSLSSAKKKAEAAKIVQEMNQLKTALELYKTDKGKYPNEDVSALKCNSVSNRFITCDEDISVFFNRELVDKKYIASLPFSDFDFSPWNSIGVYGTGSRLYEDEFGYNITCGGKKVRSYILEFYSNKDLNYPKAGFFHGGVDNDFEMMFESSSNDHWYCIGE